MTTKLDQDELALRMLEAAVGMKRPAIMRDATAVLDAGPVNLAVAYRRKAAAALAYFIECAGALTIIPQPVQPSGDDREDISTRTQ